MGPYNPLDVIGSPSSRRAWIEIQEASVSSVMPSVALLAEGVDRNTEREDKVAERNLSPSSRRAWIEILFHTKISDKTVQVALLAEGVDRNNWVKQNKTGAGRRPPRGGRG